MFYQQPWADPDSPAMQPQAMGYLGMQPPTPNPAAFLGALGAGLSSAARQPGSFGVGFQNALGGMQEAQQNQIRNQYQALQMQALMQKMQQEGQERQMKQEGVKGLLDYLGGQGRASMGGADALSQAQSPNQANNQQSANALANPQQIQLAQYLAAMGDYDKAVDVALKGSMGADPSYTQPVAGVDAQGNPVYFQADKAGNLKVINGIKPNQQNPLSKAMLEADQKKLDRATEASDNASTMLSTIQNFKNALQNFETGPGAEYRLKGGQIDQSLLGGKMSNQTSVAAGETLKNFGTNFVLGFVQQTKGAISDREMNLFSSASPGLQNTRQGNLKIANAMEAGAQRTVEKSSFLRSYIEQNGSLSGADTAWKKYTNENPIVDKNLNINSGNISNWQPYLAPGYSAMKGGIAKPSQATQSPTMQAQPAQQQMNPAQAQVQSIQVNQRASQLQAMAQEAIKRGANPQAVQARLQEQLKSLGG